MILPIKQLNFLREFLFDPCDAPLIVYARAFFPALLILIITWFTPDLLNILFNATKPTKALAKRRSGRKGRRGSKAYRAGSKWSRLNPFRFDQDEFIGKKIQGTTNFASRSIGGLEWRLWIVYGVIERIGYKLFVINTVTDFFYNWMSLVEESVFCRMQRALVVLRQETGGIHLGSPGWYGLYSPEVLKQRGLSSGFASVLIPAGVWVNVSGGGSFEPLHETSNYVAEVRIRDANHVFAEARYESQLGEKGECAVEHRIRGPRLVHIEARVSVNSQYDSIMSAIGTGSPINP